MSKEKGAVYLCHCMDPRTRCQVRRYPMGAGLEQGREGSQGEEGGIKTADKERRCMYGMDKIQMGSTDRDELTQNCLWGFRWRGMSLAAKVHTRKNMCSLAKDWYTAAMTPVLPSPS